MKVKIFGAKECGRVFKGKKKGIWGQDRYLANPNRIGKGIYWQKYIENSDHTIKLVFWCMKTLKSNPSH